MTAVGRIAMRPPLGSRLAPRHGGDYETLIDDDLLRTQFAQIIPELRNDCALN